MLLLMYFSGFFNSIISSSICMSLNCIHPNDYNNDPYFAPICKALQNNKSTAQTLHYNIKYDLIYLKNTDRLPVPNNKEVCILLLGESHDNKIAGHFGVEKTYLTITSDPR